jgi:3-dehydroquinate synthase II
MKKIWVQADPWNKDIVIRALECGADAVVVPKGHTSKVKELGLIPTVAEDGDIALGEDVFRFGEGKRGRRKGRELSQRQDTDPPDE